nr:MAG TPA: hypothetical protein [Caudoviricetes sp.]
MPDEIRHVVRKYKMPCAAILAILLVGIAYAVGRYAGHEAAEEKPTVMTQEEAQDARETTRPPRHIPCERQRARKAHYGDTGGAGFT